MSELKVCRICLRNESKFYRLNIYNLKSIYENLTSYRLPVKDRLPQYVCYECAALLYKFNQFKEKCIDGQNVLQEILQSGPITYARVSELNMKKVHKCQNSFLEMLITSDHVKVYNIKHSSVCEVKNSQCLKEEEVIGEYFDDRFYDNDDLELKNQETDPVPEELSFDMLNLKPKQGLNADKEIVSNIADVLDGLDKKCLTEDSQQAKQEVVLVECSDYVHVELNNPEKDLVTQDIPDFKSRLQGINGDRVTVDDIASVADVLDTKPVLAKKILNGLLDTKPKVEKPGKVVKIRLKRCKEVTPYKKEAISKSTKKKRQTKPVKKIKSKCSTKDYTEENNDSSKEVLSKRKRKKKKDNPPIPLEEADKYKFSKPKKTPKLEILNSEFWKKCNLTEEDAWNSFKAKAHDNKYLNAAYKCSDCYKGFSKHSMLERHMVLRHSEAIGKFVCRFCKMRFKQPSYMHKHMRQHYFKYECQRCDLVCTAEESALLHEEYHRGVIRKCSHCNKEFKHLSTFYTHLRTHRSKHICSLCGESFVSERGLRIHTKNKHVKVSEQQPLKPVEENTYCDVCQIKFETKDAFDKHLAHSALHVDLNTMDTYVTKNLVDKEKTEAGNTEENGTKVEEVYNRESRVEFKLSAIRKRNMSVKGSDRTHHRKPTTCRHCGEHFKSSYACMKHHSARHRGLPFYTQTERVICEVCGLSLAPGSVSAHQNTHTRSKLYTCNVCNRSFAASVGLKTHMVVHTGEKRFACQLCDKRFTQSGSLSLHVRTIHLKLPYPRRNRKKKVDEPMTDGF